MSLFTSRTDVVVSGALDGLAARHKAYASNLANVDTPGFQPSEVPFEEHLREVRDRIAADPASAEQGTRLDLTPQPDPAADPRADGNGVNVDREVVRMADNALTYEAMVSAARMRHELLKSAISGGGK